MKFNVNKIFNKENANRVVKFVGTMFLGYCAVVAKTDQTKNNKYICFSTYSGAMNAIMKSTMYSSDKTDITKLLLPNASEDYYSSVISIANSTMCVDMQEKTIFLQISFAIASHCDCNINYIFCISDCQE